MRHNPALLALAILFAALFVFAFPSHCQTLRINAGGPAIGIGDSGWLADRYATGGYVYTQYPPHVQPIYNDVRAGTKFAYAIPVTQGDYDVRLKLIELSATAAGERIFDVTITGGSDAPVFATGVDIFAAVGANLPHEVILRVPVPVYSATLNLAFASRAGSRDAVVFGIELERLPKPMRVERVESYRLTAPRQSFQTLYAVAPGSCVTIHKNGVLQTLGVDYRNDADDFIFFSNTLPDTDHLIVLSYSTIEPLPRLESEPNAWRGACTSP